MGVLAAFLKKYKNRRVIFCLLSTREIRYNIILVEACGNCNRTADYRRKVPFLHSRSKKVKKRPISQLGGI